MYIFSKYTYIMYVRDGISYKKSNCNIEKSYVTILNQFILQYINVV